MKRLDHPRVFQTLKMMLYKLIENPEYLHLQSAAKFRNKHRNSDRKGLEAN